MAKEKQKNTGTISYSNYLHINGGPKPDNNVQTSTPAATDADVEATDSASSVSLDNVLTTEVFIQGHHHQPRAKSLWPKFSLADTPSDGIGKEEAVRRKADSLGLLSHKWAKNFIERGFMNGCLPKKMYYDYSRPATRGNSTSSSSDSTPKRSTKDLSSNNEKMQVLNKLYNSSKPKSAWNVQRQAIAQKDCPKRPGSIWKPASVISARRPPTRYNQQGKSSVKNSARKGSGTNNSLKWSGPLCTFQQEELNSVGKRITPK